jgi:hypothetical protein
MELCRISKFGSSIGAESGLPIGSALKSGGALAASAIVNAKYCILK